MTPIQTQLHRLYLPHSAPGVGDHADSAGLIAPDGTVRGLVLELARPADWEVMSLVWRGVQADLDLPAPAIAVNGVDGYQLWFSLAQAVPVADALGFLEALRLRYFGGIAVQRVGLMPPITDLVPTLQQATARWSAFVAPDLAAIFGDEPWLDLPPNPDAQAQVLSRLAAIKPADFEAALRQLQPGRLAGHSAKATQSSGTSLVPLNAVPTHTPSTTLPAKSPVTPHAVPPAMAASTTADASQGPKRFLLDVMADTQVELHLRIEAAKALLPYCEGPAET